jgi:hypothetical protein
MAILPTDIRILFTNYDIIAYFFKPGFLFRTFYKYKTSNIGNFWYKQKKISFKRVYAFNT